MNTEEINKICIKNGLNQLKMSKVLTWVDISNTEGIEIQMDKIVSFWVRDFQRVYGEIPSNNIQIVLNEINSKVNNNTETKQEPPQERKEEEIITHDTTHNNTVLVPETITELLVVKYQKMNTFQRMLMFQNTAEAHIKWKQKGGKKIAYVEGNFMQLEANISFLFAWSDFTTDKHFDESGCSVFGGVTANIDGKEITHTAIGIDLQEFTKQDKKPVFTTHELFKNAHTDMIKKALSKFGFNNDVYRGDV